MPRIDRRRFGLLDMLILIAASAVALLAMRGFFRDFLPEWNYRVPPNWGYRVRLGLAFLSPWLASYSVAFLVIALRRPRGRIRRRLRAPGTAACLTASLGMLLGGLITAPPLVVYGIPSGTDFFFRTLYWGILLLGALPVLAAWMFLLIARRWRSSPTWIDRGGRLLGLGWVLLFLLDTTALTWGQVPLATMFPRFQEAPPPPNFLPTPSIPEPAEESTPATTETGKSEDSKK